MLFAYRLKDLKFIFNYYENIKEILIAFVTKPVVFLSLPVLFHVSSYTVIGKWLGQWSVVADLFIQYFVI